MQYNNTHCLKYNSNFVFSRSSKLVKRGRTDLDSAYGRIPQSTLRPNRSIPYERKGFVFDEHGDVLSTGSSWRQTFI